MFKRISAFLFFIILSTSVFAAINDSKLPFNISFYKDNTNSLTINNVVNKPFQAIQKNFLNFGVENSTYWLKITPFNNNKLSKQFIYIEQPRLQIINLFHKKENGEVSEVNRFLFNKDSLRINSRGASFLLPDTVKNTDVFYVQLKAHEALITRLAVTQKIELDERYQLKDLIFGLYSGLMLTMFVYNLFLFVVVKDKSYIYYVFYIFFTWITQVSIQGFNVIFFAKNTPIINQYGVVFYSLMGLIFASLFTLSFLNTKIFAPKIHQTIKLLIALILVNILLLFFLEIHASFILMQIVTLLGVIIALSSSYYVYFKKRFKPAGFYLIAWSILLLGAVLFILKDYGIIPYSNVARYLLQIASAIEVVLLSFALADKINYFKKENQNAQAQALAASLKNEQLIREQNLILERNVKQRTEELENTNETLNSTLNNLKSAQSQLVNSEKMAALGQLTAGIAHEINNPINFVTSNVKPLQLDIDDLKEVIARYEKIDAEKDLKQQLAEIDEFKKQIDLAFINQEITSLLSGISEGAKRTAEIIRSLKNFSRVDETDLKGIDLNEGILSTLVLIKNTLPDNLTVVKDLGNLPKVECMPGKINQVFMNLISNAIQAIKSKPNQNNQEFLNIKTWYSNNNAFISIKDTGTGMSEETKQRIFEPFFTTKEIGEGTGLGLSIVFSIIEKHNGSIKVLSKIDEGTEFVITLPIN